MKQVLPMRTAPAISKMVARIHACRMVKTLDPTEVPKLLATSLAPTPKARTKETINPLMTIHNTSGLTDSTNSIVSVVGSIVPNVV